MLQNRDTHNDWQTIMLSEKEKVVLAACCLDADLPVQEIAKRTGLKDHVVRRALDSIEASGAVRRVTYIDVYPLGLYYFEVYFRFLPGTGNKSAILEYLQSSPFVSYLAQTGGDYECNIHVIARRPAEVMTFLEDVAERFQGVFADKQVLLIESLCDFPLRFLGDHSDAHRSLSFGNTKSSVEIDELDHRILRLLSSTHFRSVTEIARMLGAKLSTVQYRLDRLRDNRVFVGTRYIANLPALGYQVFDIHVQTRGVSKAVKNAINTFADAEPSVYALLRTAGVWDFVLISAVPAAAQIEPLINRLSEVLGSDLVRATAHPLIRQHKVSFYPLETYNTSGAIISHSVGATV
jgi:DNA-binding Lrp family transcriptional regulator